MIKKFILIVVLFLTTLSCGFKPIMINQTKYFILKTNENLGLCDDVIKRVFSFLTWRSVSVRMRLPQFSPWFCTGR